MNTLKDTFLKQLQTISKLHMMKSLTPFLYGEDALLLKLFLKEATSPKTIADTLNITKGRVTAIMSSLRKKGFIELKKNQLDGRSVELNLTLEGTTYIQNKLDFIDNYFETLLSHIGLTQSKALVEMLNNLLISIRKIEENNNG